ncbi:receptor-like protein kinase HSL1 [Cocos nucifera]|uniref:non-specific serine/threonine protein kinase n=1 Tax=Cocos nucifera TaxID=13894 RepID=A0A8K0IAF3_COCNU|nr:receptor-like protein kinase HSL1 [Cocos nucifera]
MAATAISSSFILLVIVSFYSEAASQTTTADGEKQILLRIKEDWGNPSALSSWNDSTSTNHCNWTGIGCSADGSITDITLANQNINQPIPANICELRSLSILDLSYNNITTSFPKSLYNCSNLQYLDISQNYFIGVIPSDIYHLSPRLTTLILSSNNFTGDIPSSIGQLRAIEYLALNNNHFNVSFPAELGNLLNLQTLLLAYNPFNPTSIPSTFHNLTQLSYLWMTQTNLKGEIPEFIGELTQMYKLDLSENSLNGSIPAGIWNLKNLQYLYLYSNNLTGEIKIDGEIGALELERLDVSINQLNGSIPEEFGKLPKLSILLMYENRFSGEIPASIGLLPELTELRLFRNSLTGVLPPQMGEHSPLWNVEVDDNMISGELPENLCAGLALNSIIVSNNNLTGNLPASLGNCSTLGNIMIQNNRFSGDFPAGIWSSAVNLSTVKMQDNALSGTLPDKLPWNLSRLEMENNRFSGNIPSWAGNLLVFLADNNSFSGEIPANMTGLSKLQTLSLGGNQISGEIPPAISMLKGLTMLNLSHNQLTGEIPALIGSLPVLNTLDLSVNQLSGVIPTAIGNHINVLNLSSNRLTGEIPISLRNPAYGHSFLSNPQLCSSDLFLNVRSCEQRSGGSDGLSRGVLIMFIVLGILIFVIAAGFAIFVIRDCRRRKDGDDLAKWKLTSFQSLDFTETAILRGLTEENLIGSGGSGEVYRIHLGSRARDIVAVKKICNSRKLDSRLEEEFQSEVQILSSIRHINIVKLLCCVSSVDSMLLVYEYMGNGSLDRWLHGKRRVEGASIVPGGLESGPRPLDWPARLRIAVGAAHGLCYMHHDYSPPIVHRDVKSSNILLDSEFRAKIADFGLARMLAKSGEPDTASTVAGSFGYMAPVSTLSNVENVQSKKVGGECAYSRKVNEKVDVYSFGVVLLELATGREANDGGEHGSLAEWIWSHVQDGNKLMDVIDQDIRDPLYVDEIVAVLKLAIICTGTLPSARRTMKEVLQILLRYERMHGIGDKPLVEYDGAPLLETKRGSRNKRSSDGDECSDDGSLARNV